MNETNRLNQDRTKFKAICNTIGFNNAVEGLNELNSVGQDYNMLSKCLRLSRALVMQTSRPRPQHRPNRAEQRIKALMSGRKITLGGVF